MSAAITEATRDQAERTLPLGKSTCQHSLGSDGTRLQLAVREHVVGKGDAGERRRSEKTRSEWVVESAEEEGQTWGVEAPDVHPPVLQYIVTQGASRRFSAR
jgi:hypothetical protein